MQNQAQFASILRNIAESASSEPGNHSTPQSGATVTVVPTHTANAPSAKPEPAAKQPIVGIEAVSAITSAETANREKLKAALQAKRSAKPPVADKPANKQAAAKRVGGKTKLDGNPTNTPAAKPAKPTAEARAAAQRDAIDAHRLARDVAGQAVRQFYDGRSLPFKAASDRFADINASNAKAPSTRQAALLLALITYGAGNMRSDGTFTRGAFVVPAKLLNPNAKPGDTVKAQPESGCLGNMLGRAVRYVSGPRTGREQSNAVYRLNVPVALGEIQAAFGDKQAAAATKLLAGFTAKAA